MKRIILCILGLCPLLSAGCGLTRDISRTVVAEPLRVADEGMECLQNRLSARSAWKEVAREEPGHKYSTHYVRGFMQGYADYVEGGGTGEAPSLPPRCYWKTSGNLDDVHDWASGFARGAAAARASGRREEYVVPVKTSSYGPANVPAAGHNFPQALPVTSPSPSEVVLPAPRKIPDTLPAPKETPALPKDVKKPQNPAANQVPTRPLSPTPSSEP